MSLAEQVTVIKRGLLSDTAPADNVEMILDDGTHLVVNWRTVRPALVALKASPWCELNNQWDFFLDEQRYPSSNRLEIDSNRTQIYQRLVQQLVSQINEPMRVLTSVIPDIPDDSISVRIDSKDLAEVETAIGHVRQVSQLAATGDAFEVVSFQSGSLEILLAAAQLTKVSIELAILLANRLKSQSVVDLVRSHLRLLKRHNPEEDIDEAKVREIIHEDEVETFWESAQPVLDDAIKRAGGSYNVNDARNKINKTAQAMGNAENCSVEWRLSPVTLQELPGNLTAHLDNPTPLQLTETIKAIKAAYEE